MSEDLAAAQRDMLEWQRYKYICVACLTLLIAEWLQMLYMEYKHMWRARWGPIRALYFITRYLVFVDFALIILLNGGYAASDKSCSGVSRALLALSLFGICLAEALMSHRAFVITCRNKWAGRILITQGVVMYSTMLGLFITYERATTVKRAHALQSLDDQTFSACALALMNASSAGLLRNLSTSIFAVLLFSQISTILVSLCFYAHVNRVHLSKPGHLTRSVHAHGLLTFVVLSSTTVACLALTRSNVPPPTLWMLFVLLRTLYSVLPARLVLHMRALAKSLDIDEAATTHSEIRFNEPAGIASLQSWGTTPATRSSGHSSGLHA